MTQDRKITQKQVKWLDDRGGRRVVDVLEDEQGMYVLMSAGSPGRDMKVYIPVK